MSLTQSVEPDRIGPYLLAGEQVLWSGRPIRRWVLRLADLKNLASGVFLVGIGVVSYYTIPASGPTLMREAYAGGMMAFGILQVFAGILDRASRFGRTWYVLTDRRAIEVTSRKVRSLKLTELDDMAVRVRPDGSGTIAFGGTPGSPASSRSLVRVQTNGLISDRVRVKNQLRVMSFDEVADVQRVEELINTYRKGLR